MTDLLQIYEWMINLTTDLKVGPSTEWMIVHGPKAFKGTNPMERRRNQKPTCQTGTDNERHSGHFRCPRYHIALQFQPFRLLGSRQMLSAPFLVFFINHRMWRVRHWLDSKSAPRCLFIDLKYDGFTLTFLPVTIDIGYPCV